MTRDTTWLALMFIAIALGVVMMTFGFPLYITGALQVALCSFSAAFRIQRMVRK